ncbi:MAG: RluA family pseudouridine synthase [Oscillospiraceae bacterium]|jgi:23S rRNA pseudouridine1911/1915/1917 synthase|nr:RluA family pseudouridine synthase [Oscillospiraceae bacterium]
MTVKITDAQAGARLDAAVALAAPELTRSFAAKLIASGGVTLNGRTAAKSARVAAGDELSFTVPEPEPAEALPQNIPLDIAYEDDDVVVVDKPRGMVVHPAPGHPDGTLVNALLAHCGSSLSGIGGVFRPGIVHRIDRDTSGLIIAAKNDFAHRGLAAQLKDHSLYRVYECVVRGGMREDSGTVDAPVGRHPTQRKKQAVTPKNSRNAVTHWEVLERFSGYTRLRCRLETGRTHQIRVHMAHLGRPIAGDALYGGRDPKLKLSGQCLHAVSLGFTHPRTGERVLVESGLPPWFCDVLQLIRRGS